jgi:hypothetical protein
MQQHEAGQRPHLAAFPPDEAGHYGAQLLQAAARGGVHNQRVGQQQGGWGAAVQQPQ